MTLKKPKVDKTAKDRLMFAIEFGSKSEIMLAIDELWDAALHAMENEVNVWLYKNGSINEVPA